MHYCEVKKLLTQMDGFEYRGEITFRHLSIFGSHRTQFPFRRRTRNRLLFRIQHRIRVRFVNRGIQRLFLHLFVMVQNKKTRKEKNWYQKVTTCPCTENLIERFYNNMRLSTQHRHRSSYEVNQTQLRIMIEFKINCSILLSFLHIFTSVCEHYHVLLLLHNLFILYALMKQH